MNSRKTRQMLYGFTTLVMITIVVIMYLLVKDKNYTEISYVNNWDFKIKPFHSKKQNLLFLKSQISSSTSNSKTAVLNEKPKPGLPWYFKDGTNMPTKALVNRSTSHLWPEERKDNDRIEEQLMFIPPNYQHDNEPIKKILFYNGVASWDIENGQHIFINKKCPVNRCEITTNKSEASDVDAVMFRDGYLHPDHNKSTTQIWIMFFLESPYNIHTRPYNGMINWTATYRHDSEIVTPYERWAYYDPSVTQVKQLVRNYAENKTKQVAMIASNCNTPNDRLKYANELAKYIPVDIYGDCGKFNCSTSECFRLLEEEYKFYLAFENSNCADYITEKLFINGLQHNVLPIVMGGSREDYRRTAPKNSYLHVNDFESPKRLAEYLRQLDADDELYNEYFRWKGTGEFIDTKFFCRLCAMLHDNSAPTKYYADFQHWWNGPNVCNNTRLP